MLVGVVQRLVSMCDHSESNTVPWADHLVRLYPDDIAADIARRIAALSDSYRARLKEQDARPLSERDVLLITYGDTIQDSAAPPLQVLHRFYRQSLSDLFSLIHVLPFQPFSSDAGFSVIDYYEVREDLGDWGDVVALSKDCGLMVDAVINHMSSQSSWFRGFLDGKKEYTDFFVEGDPAADHSAVVRPRTSDLLTAYKNADGHTRQIWTTFSADQVDLNYRNPEVLLGVLDVLMFLVRQGARLLRLDAVTYLWKEPGTSCANLPETHAIIKLIRGVLADLCPDVLIITETNVPHRENVAYFGDGHDEAHMVYNFALPPLIAHSFIQADGRRLSEWASSLSLPSDEVCFLNFSACHDGVGVRPVEEIMTGSELDDLVAAAVAAGGQVSCRTIDDEERPYELNCTFLDLLAKSGEGDEMTAARFVASQAIVLAMPGVPAVYIHSLLATRNDVARVRQTGRARSINRSRLKYADVERSLDNAASLTSMVFTGLTRLVAARQQQPAFHPHAGFQVLDLGPEVFAIARQNTDRGGRVVAIVNLTATDTTINIDGPDSGRDVLSGKTIDAGPNELAAYAVLWIRCTGDDH